MYSRAHLLIKRDFERFTQDPPWGIEAQPLADDNIFEWSAKIQGMRETIWEGGLFQVYIKFNEHYNSTPPEVCFHTIPFHPNIDSITGRPCINFLDDPTLWKETYSFGFVLLSIQNLLSNPVLDDAINPDAAAMLVNSYHSYKQMAQDCVLASRRFEAGLSLESTVLDDKIRFGVPEKPPTPEAPPKVTPKKIKKMSFEDYHKGWSGIATSKTHPDTVNPLLEMLQDDPVMEEVHLGISRPEIEQQVKKQLQEHSKLIYGKFKNAPTSEEELDAKIAKLQHMRKIYLPSKTPTTAPPSRIGAISQQDTILNAPTVAQPAVKNIEDPWDQDVDELVAWTTNLDEDNL
ncbi:unnamed protein product [Owenia fusiformis]|uniref:Uncharacterized protein n=1 Tax=Owenia fusiformis TaxID=6347 RepID=A0A8J1UCN5_OWEFU|nr:unnamed protein product [Owenia fusiformis]